MMLRKVAMVMIYLFCILVFSASAADENLVSQSQLPTVTVRGFLNFRTTVDGTVIVFTPASEADGQATRPSTLPLQSTHAPLQSNALDSSEGSEIQDLAYTQVPGHEPRGHLKSTSGELDQEAQKAKESFRHISDNVVLPSSANSYPGESLRDVSQEQGVRGNGQYPTGLVTVLGGKHVDGSATTVFETKVIGTYIDGKYAQILQSTSTILYAPPEIESTAPSPTPSSSTTQPSATTTLSKPVPSATKPFSTTTKPTASATKSVSTAKPVTSTSAPSISVKSTSPSEISSSFSKSTTSTPVLASTSPRQQETTTSATYLQSSFRSLDTTTQKSFSPTQSLDSVKTSDHNLNSRVFRSKHSDEDNTVLKSRNDGSTSSRIRFTSPSRHWSHARPSSSSSAVVLNRFKVRLTNRHNSTDATPAPDDEEEEEREMEIVDEEDPFVSVDPARVVKELATITSEVTLHVGRRKSVRTLTITTTVQRTLEPSELASNGILGDMKTSDPVSSTNVPDDVILTGAEGTPSLVVTRTFTTTEHTWRTSLVPIFDGLTTSIHTVTESLFIRKIITAYRTMPSGNVTVIEDSSTSDSETALTLEPAANVQVVASTTPLPPVVPALSSTQQQLLLTPSPLAQVDQVIQPSPYMPVSKQPQIADPLISLGAALSNNPLAAVYLGLQQLNLQATMYSTITKTSSFLTTDTVYSTRTVRLYNGRSTRTRVLSDSVSTTVRTVITTSTTVQPFINTHVLQQQQQLQSLIATQLPRPFPPPPQYSTITNVYTTVTTATSLSTRIYTLTYNAFSTKFRTVTSTSLYPTTVTVTSTKEVPLAPTAPVGPYPFPYPA